MIVGRGRKEIVRRRLTSMLAVRAFQAKSCRMLCRARRPAAGPTANKA